MLSFQALLSEELFQTMRIIYIGPTLFFLGIKKYSLSENISRDRPVCFHPMTNTMLFMIVCIRVFQPMPQFWLDNI